MPDPVPERMPDPEPDAADGVPGHAASWTVTARDCPDLEIAAARLWLAGAVAVEERGPTLVGHFDERVDLAAADLVGRGAADDDTDRDDVDGTPRDDGEDDRHGRVEDGPLPRVTWSRRATVDHMAAWRAASTAVRAGRFDLVPAHLVDEHVTPDDVHRLVVDAGMAFGSGHHATTAGCLEALSALDVRGQRVLDVGTGTGVLAIAAARSGARHVVGVDTDPHAIEVATANVARNGVEVDLAVGSTEVVDGPFDGILANLLTNLVVELAPRLAALLAPDGWLVASGIGIPRAPAVVDALAAAGFRRVATHEREDWAVITAIRATARDRVQP